MIRARPQVAEMAAYALADLSVPEGTRLVSLSQNESLRGPSEEAVLAAASALRAAHLYPDPNWTALTGTLAALHGLAPEAILCGCGSLDLIGCIARTYLGQGDAALAPAHAYPFFATATRLTGARFDTAPEHAWQADVDALLAAVTPETRVVFIANPGNPTGTRLPRSEVLRLRDGLPADILLVLDEAYGEFSDHLNEPMFDLVERGDTIVLRTFSKAYGLAGARVGWGAFPDMIARDVRKALNPNAVTLASQAAALAASEDQSWMRETCAQTVAIREAFAARLRKIGFDVPQSFTNFVLVPFATDTDARNADAYLKSHGVFLRAQSGAGLPQCLRATIGAREDMDLAAALLQSWVQGRAQT